MKLKLEDLTRDELIHLIRKYAWLHATPKDLLSIRWGSLTMKAQNLLRESIKAGESRDWRLAEGLYQKYLKVTRKADAVWAAFMEQR